MPEVYQCAEKCEVNYVRQIWHDCRTENIHAIWLILQILSWSVFLNVYVTAQYKWCQVKNLCCASDKTKHKFTNHRLPTICTHTQITAS